MSFKRIALCVMYAMITMFVVNTCTAYAEEESEFNTQQIQVQDVTAAPEEVQVTYDNESVNNIDASLQNVESSEAVIEQGATGVATEDADEDIEESNSSSKKVSKNSSKKKSASKKYSKADLRLMSAIIYCEAGVEPYAGKVAVGIVVMNRKESSAFPNSVKGVIYQRYQFSPVRNGSLKKALARYDKGKFNSGLYKQCVKAAKEALSGVKSVEYNGKKINCSKFKFFSGGLRGAKVTIKGHRFK